MSGKRVALGAFLSAALLVGASLPSRAAEGVSRTVEQQGPVRVGEKAPSFGGFLPDGSVTSLDRLLKAGDGPLVVSFFASWCGPCREGLPVIQRVARSGEARGAKASVILVSFGEDAAVAAKFLEEVKIDLPFLPDPYATVGARLGVDKRLPRTFVLDKEGRVRTIFVTEGADFEDRLHAALEEASAPLPATGTAKTVDVPAETGAAFTGTPGKPGAPGAKQP